jgi:hypothetical protein
MSREDVCRAHPGSTNPYRGVALPEPPRVQDDRNRGTGENNMMTTFWHWFNVVALICILIVIPILLWDNWSKKPRTVLQKIVMTVILIHYLLLVVLDIHKRINYYG